MITRSREWEPGTSPPGNVEGHMGPLVDCATPQLMVDNVRYPAYFADLLERHKDSWKVSFAATICMNCLRGIVIILIYEPVQIGPFIKGYQYLTKYSFEAG